MIGQYRKFSFFALMALLIQASGGEVLDRYDGIRIGERLTIRPSVAGSITYDSNVDCNSGRNNGSDKDDFFWMISPQLWLHYNAETWSVILSGFYNYRHYFKGSHSRYNRQDYGEDLRFNWANSSEGEKGWSLIIGESFHQITAMDNMIVDGRTYDSDARQFQISGALQRRFNERLHADLNASYYWLDYENDTRAKNAYYGWDRWMVGLEAGYVLSKWTDLVLSGSYQGYSQENVSGSDYSGESQGFTIMGGLGSYLTERISYRLLAGWSWFEYGDNGSGVNGLVYSASANWKIGETWNTMLLASSYYQPSERQYSSQSRIDAISWGLAKVMVRGKLRSTLDLRYRRETNEYLHDSSLDYVLNVFTGRIGLDYSLNQFLSAFVFAEYQKSMNDESRARRDAYDYDRWRIGCGMRLSY